MKPSSIGGPCARSRPRSGSRKSSTRRPMTTSRDRRALPAREASAGGGLTTPGTAAGDRASRVDLSPFVGRVAGRARCLRPNRKREPVEHRDDDQQRAVPGDRAPCTRGCRRPWRRAGSRRTRWSTRATALNRCVKTRLAMKIGRNASVDRDEEPGDRVESSRRSSGGTSHASDQRRQRAARYRRAGCLNVMRRETATAHEHAEQHARGTRAR